VTHGNEKSELQKLARIRRSLEFATHRCAPAAAIHDQKLMFNENGLGEDRTQAAGTDEPENCGDEMDQENNEIAHVRIDRNMADSHLI
jgi:hypothetical protein